jgi:hypothetical protein
MPHLERSPAWTLAGRSGGEKTVNLFNHGRFSRRRDNAGDIGRTDTVSQLDMVAELRGQGREWEVKKAMGSVVDFRLAERL